MHCDIGNYVDFQGEEVSDNEMKENPRSDNANHKPCLTVKTGFVWDVPDTLENPQLESESEDEEQSKVYTTQFLPFHLFFMFN